MRRKHTRIFARLLSLAMIVSLAACSSSSGKIDAQLYIKGMMDETYLGVFEPDYLEMVETTEKEAQENYLSGLEYEYETYFASSFEIDDASISDAMRDDLVDLLGKIYAKSKYDVKTAKKNGDVYMVEVVVSPLDVLRKVAEEDQETFADDFNARYADMSQEKLDRMTAAQQEQFWKDYEEEWAAGILALCLARLETVGYLDDESIIVQVKPDPADGYYTISDTDFSNLDALILAY